MRIKIAILLYLSYNNGQVFFPDALGPFKIHSGEHKVQITFLIQIQCR